jgi:hypothetical protein
LRRCPQDETEVWQVDALRNPEAGQEVPDGEEPWAVVIVGRTSQSLLGLEIFDAEPKAQEV